MPKPNASSNRTKANLPNGFRVELAAAIVFGSTLMLPFPSHRIDQQPGPTEKPSQLPAPSTAPADNNLVPAVPLAPPNGLLPRRCRRAACRPPHGIESRSARSDNELAPRARPA